MNQSFDSGRETKQIVKFLEQIQAGCLRKVDTVDSETWVA